FVEASDGRVDAQRGSMMLTGALCAWITYIGALFAQNTNTGAFSPFRRWIKVEELHEPVDEAKDGPSFQKTVTLQIFLRSNLGLEVENLQKVEQSHRMDL
ncbi:hypothetical protein HAX54_018627, partial [Datura stramonium]|nr:hypothetical protein [Datura stramonium]